MAVPKDHETFEYEQHKRHILFNGTQLLQGRPEGNNVYLKAVVIRTGPSLYLSLCKRRKQKGIGNNGTVQSMTQ